MSHSEKRSSAGREAALALLTGMVFGGTHAITGHPLDTIKSKMQVEHRFMKSTATEVAHSIMKEEGIRGFFRGVGPPLWGSMVYRGIMMSAYEYLYTSIEQEFPPDSFMRCELSPYFPLRLQVVSASVFAATCRGVIESPIEYAKVMLQIKQQWQWRDIYRGVPMQMARTVALLISIFSSMDIARRHSTLLSSSGGTFVVTSVASGGAYVLCWPLETLKNMAQAGVPKASATVSERITHLGGLKGVYRGVVPGALAGSIRGGFATVAMVLAQRLATHVGLRD